ncbi:hypothetical protein LIER_15959 [Lithospermum erythrorhizon]|uniref:Uncharacterized protein n=1 Tax=Lithospermum erythrorhizon TaxID=34254 RepID=A0AAV3Q9H9_LITER
MFSKIGSYLGNPLYADGATSDVAHISYARIYVEVEAAKEIPEVVPLVDENNYKYGGAPQLEEMVVGEGREVPGSAVVVKVANPFATLETVEDPIEAGVVSPGNSAQASKTISISGEAQKHERNKKHLFGKVKCVVDGFQLMLSVVYGSNNKIERRKLWDSMKQASSIVGDKAWIARGDYNIVRASSEAVGGGILDAEAFILATVDIPVAAESDHCSLNINVMPVVEQEPKPFKYQHFWNQHHQFNSIVNECWERDVVGHGIAGVKEKQIELDEINCKIYGGNVDPDVLRKATNLNA